MKKNIILTMMVICVALNVNAQETEKNYQEFQSGIGIDYSAVKDGGAVGMDLLFNHFLVGYAFGWGKDTDYIKDQSSWQIELGGNHRFFLGTKYLFLEARAMVGYAHGKFKYVAGTETKTSTSGVGRMERTHTYTTTKWEEESNGDFYLAVSPRLGLNLIQLKNGRNIAIVCGYRWNFTKFKFDKDHTSDFLTIGIAGVF